MTIKCRTLSFSLIFVIILNTVNLISDSETEVPVNTLVVLVHELAGYLYLIRAT